jgi:hypothetical protein
LLLRVTKNEQFYGLKFKLLSMYNCSNVQCFSSLLSRDKSSIYTSVDWDVEIRPLIVHLQFADMEMIVVSKRSKSIPLLRPFSNGASAFWVINSTEYYTLHLKIRMMYYFISHELSIFRECHWKLVMTFRCLLTELRKLQDMYTFGVWRTWFRGSEGFIVQSLNVQNVVFRSSKWWS